MHLLVQAFELTRGRELQRIGSARFSASIAPTNDLAEELDCALLNWLKAQGLPKPEAHSIPNHRG